MISFKQVYTFSDAIPGIYSEAELYELYKLVRGLPDHSTVMEIGVLYGRSASVYLQLAKAGKPLDIHLIDPWIVSESDTYKYFHQMVDENFRDVPFTMWNMTSEMAESRFGHEKVDLLHVDGDHSPDGIATDVGLWVDRVADVAVFHDYNTLDVDGKTLVFPQIQDVVDDAFEVSEWESLGVHGSQAKFRRRLEESNATD